MNTKQYSDLQEITISRELGWDKVTCSGARDLFPGDIQSDKWLGECKTHTSIHKIEFNLNVWSKICEEAMSRFKFPVLFVDNGTQKLNHTWCLFNTEMPNDKYYFQEYPYAIKTNIIFDTKDLEKYEKSCEVRSYLPVVFHALWGGKDIKICSFNTFREAFGE